MQQLMVQLQAQSDKLDKQSNQLSERMNTALNEVEGNMEQVHREMIGQRYEWGDEDELQNQTTIAQNQSSRNEDELNALQQTKGSRCKITKGVRLL